jgi:hypothetical protein
MSIWMRTGNIDSERERVQSNEKESSLDLGLMEEIDWTYSVVSYSHELGQTATTLADAVPSRIYSIKDVSTNTLRNPSREP